ncbi:MAG: zf-HC2 domain-containing protein [Candidatus Eisenbacteria bacterium]
MNRESRFCKKARGSFSAYYDGTLSPKNSSKLVEHFDACDSCKKRYERYCALLNGVRALPRVRPSGDFEARLFARVRQEGRIPARTSWWQDLARVPLPVPIGAAAILLLAVFAYTRIGGDRAPSPAPLETASRPVPADTVRTRTNTRPSFLDDLGGGAEFGRAASTELHGPPYPMEAQARPAILAVPLDLNGVPIEGPYEHAQHAQGARAWRGSSGDSGGAVDTSPSR